MFNILKNTSKYFSDQKITQLRLVGKKGFFALVDQFFFAGAMFISSILLGRWLPPSEYGLFSLLQSIIWLLGAYYTAIFIDPMLVFGPGKFLGKFDVYFSVLYKYHRKVSLILFSIISLVGFIFFFTGKPNISNALWGTAISIPPTYLLWLFRRRFYSISKPWYSAFGSIAYFAVLFFSLWIINLLGFTNIFSAYIAFAFSAGFVVLFYKRKFSTGFDYDDNFKQDIVSNHWNYGKWALATVIFSWIPSNISYTLLSIFSSIENVASFKAIMNLILPIMQSISALAMLTLPDFVMIFRTSSLQKLNKKIWKFITLFIAIVFVYCILLLLWGNNILGYLYEGKYQIGTVILLVLCLIPFPAAIISILSNVIRAAERPKLLLFVFMASSLISLTFGIYSIIQIGLLGAVLAFLITEITTAIGLMIVKTKI